jgi:hypothetical protein
MQLSLSFHSLISLHRISATLHGIVCLVYMEKMATAFVIIGANHNMLSLVTECIADGEGFR